MMFSEIYGAYYKAVSAILKRASKDPVNAKDIRRIAGENAFLESRVYIYDAIKDGRWQLLSKDGRTPLKVPDRLPLTTLEKRWLKAISLDPRIALFDLDTLRLGDVEPLFYPEDFVVFDRYRDGDDYSDPEYTERFRTILSAIKDGSWLKVRMRTKRDKTVTYTVKPQLLEYSEKDDKFRLYVTGARNVSLINLGRIISIDKAEPKEEADNGPFEFRIRYRELILEVSNERNSRERVLNSFATFEKEAEKLPDGKLRIKLKYPKDDETEILIRILSYGPTVRVTGPDSFIRLIKERLERQRKLFG